MRALPLILLIACGVPGSGGGFPPFDAGSDANTLTGDAGEVDAGAEPVDAGFRCDPGAVFCSGAQAWACTHEGDDATVVDLCKRGGAQGTCSAAPCGADAGTQYMVWLPGTDFYCCVP